MCFLISIFLCFALVPKLVPRTVDFHWYWYRILKFWYRDNTSVSCIRAQEIDLRCKYSNTRVRLTAEFKPFTFSDKIFRVCIEYS